MSYGYDDDGFMVDSNGCFTCVEVPKVKGRFGLAWVSESPECPSPEPVGWQVEFQDTPSKVEQKCQEMVRWINCPPLPRCDPCPPDELCCPSNPPRCNPCAPKCNPCVPKCHKQCTCKIKQPQQQHQNRREKKCCCCCQQQHQSPNRPKRKCFPPMGGPCCRTRSPKRKSPLRCTCDTAGPKCICDENGPVKDNNNGGPIGGSSSGTYKYDAADKDIKYACLCFPKQVTRTDDRSNDPPPLCACETLTLYQNRNDIQFDTDTEQSQLNQQHQQLDNRKDPPEMQCICCPCNRQTKLQTPQDTQKDKTQEADKLQQEQDKDTSQVGGKSRENSFTQDGPLDGDKSLTTKDKSLAKDGTDDHGGRSSHQQRVSYDEKSHPEEERSDRDEKTGDEERSDPLEKSGDSDRKSHRRHAGDDERKSHRKHTGDDERKSHRKHAGDDERKSHRKHTGDGEGKDHHHHHHHDKVDFEERSQRISYDERSPRVGYDENDNKIGEEDYKSDDQKDSKSMKTEESEDLKMLDETVDNVTINTTVDQLSTKSVASREGSVRASASSVVDEMQKTITSDTKLESLDQEMVDVKEKSKNKTTWLSPILLRLCFKGKDHIEEKRKPKTTSAKKQMEVADKRLYEELEAQIVGDLEEP